MMFRAALALFALSAPVFAQHGGNAGSFGGRSSGHAGFSGSPGFTRSFVSPAPPVHYRSPSFHNNLAAARYGSIGHVGDRVGFRGAVPTRNLGFRVPYNTSPHVPYNGNRLGSGRSPYHRSSDGGGWDRGGHHDRDRDRFDRRRHEFNNNWYNYGNPYWLGYGYPYVIDPGFYDWDDNDSADVAQPFAYGQDGPYAQDGSGSEQGGAAPAYPTSNPDEGYRPPYQRSATPASTAAPAPPQERQPLTVIFKDGRAPVKVRNYMMTSKVLTDLDAQHYEQIPLDQVDVAATQSVNRATGVSFQVPDAARD